MSNQLRPNLLKTSRGELLNVQGVAFTYKPDSVDTDGK